MRFELLPPVPAVTLARRLKGIPLFGFASVDELFRISSIARQARYEPHAEVQKRGGLAEYIQVLVEGSFRIANGSGNTSVASPPKMLGFQEVLEGSPLSEDATAETESVALVMPAEDFRTLLSANIEMAQGLFRMLLGTPEGASAIRPVAPIRYEPRDRGLKTVEKVMFLQALPILSRATAEELYALAAIAREVDLEPATTAFTEGDPPAILLLLSGEVQLESRETTAETATAGDCLGFGDTLAGTGWARTGRVAAPGKALRIDREALLDLLAERMDLLQGIFGAIFRVKKGGDDTR